MPTSLRWTSPGLPLARSVSEAIRELQGDDPLRLVRVVAPDGATVDGLRRGLPRAGGSCGAEIGGALRLATAIAAHELGPRRVAPPVALLAIVQQVLADERSRPVAFATCATHPATHDAVVRAYRSLNGVFTLVGNHDSRLAALAGDRESASAVCQVVVAVRERLLRQGLIDEAELIRIATRGVASDPVSTTSPLVVVVTQQFNPAHITLLQALLTSAPEATVIATTSRDASLSVAAHVARLVGFPVEPPEHHASAPVPTVVSCPDHDEEVREVTRRVVGLLEQGVVADRIAIFYPAAGAHRSGIAASLAAAGVAARGQVAPPLHGSVAGQIMRALLDLAGNGLERSTIIKLARLAPFGQHPEADGTVRTTARRADKWNRYARHLGVVAERDWTAFNAAEPPDGHPDHGRHRALASFVRTQRIHRDAVRTAKSWAAVASALESWLASHCGTVEWRLGTWKGYPAWQGEAVEQVEGLFAVLADVDQFGLALRPSTLSRLVSAFLDSDVVTAESKGAGVFVDQLVGATGAVFDHVFVVGANDHLLPGRIADDLVLTRAHGAEPLGVLTGPANRPLRDQRGLLAALDGATTAATVLHSRWDVRSGGELYPSPSIPDTHTAEHVASHGAQITSSDGAWIEPSEWYARNVARSTPLLSRRRRAITARAQEQPGHFDGQVGPLGHSNPLRHTMPTGEPAHVGITSLENWAMCGLKYFVTRVLGAKTDDADPTDIADVEPMQKGTLIHAVFERLIGDWLIEHPDSARPDNTTAWIANEHDVEVMAGRAELVLDELAAPLLAGHLLGHPEMWRARRAQMLTALRRGLRAELADPVTPVASEFTFGRSPSADPLAVAHPPAEWSDPHAASPDVETTVWFAGAVDRLDRLPNGSLRVLDVKSGASKTYKSINADAPLGPNGDKLQLAFYGWAVEQLLGQPVTRAAYRFVGRPESEADVTLTITPGVHDELHQRIAQIAEAIQAGVFEPGEVGTWGCEVCAPDGLGVDEINQRRSGWRVANEPAP